jgi:LemA protein
MGAPVLSVVLIILGVGFLLLLILCYNGLVALRNRVQNGWAEVDVQLKRRHDLVPNLVEAAKAYMQHERSVLDEVARARAQATATGNDVAARGLAEAALTGALSRFLIRAENYPELRAVEEMKLLQEQLTSTENRIAFARQFYNDEVMKYNTSLMTFPRNIFAPMLGFTAAAMFTAADEDNANVQVHM